MRRMHGLVTDTYLEKTVSPLIRDSKSLIAIMYRPASRQANAKRCPTVCIPCPASPPILIVISIFISYILLFIKFEAIQSYQNPILSTRLTMSTTGISGASAPNIFLASDWEALRYLRVALTVNGKTASVGI